MARARTAKRRPVKRKKAARTSRKGPPEPLPTHLGVVLGLDVSSKTAGWCLFQNGQLHTYGKFHPPGVAKRHGERLEGYQNWLAEMLETHQPDHVVVELPYPGPRRSAYGVLMQYFGILQATYYRWSGQEHPETCWMTPRLVKQILKVRAGVSYETRKRLMVLLMNRMYKLSLRYKPKDGGKVSDDDIADAIALTHVWHMLRSRHPSQEVPPPEDFDERVALG